MTPMSAAPYIGLRPFEADECDRFFGRDRDADLLCDKILSGRLTVLYAQSGLGKSSLLRAAAIPRLERDHFRVVYFDVWSLDDPLGALKEALITAATELRIPEAGRGSPTLSELARMLVAFDGRSLILVLDQFEEFLVHHARSLQQFRTELAALLRAERLDVTVVLSLREEFLASLEPLRQHILNLFQSTYRLEPLREDGLKDAIERPAVMFGGSCEPEFVSRLTSDLRVAERPDLAGFAPAVELPMLQLVCKQLWSQAADGRLTVALYERQGGARQILEQYVRELMPKRWREQTFTARLLVHLAPPSGLKMSHAAEDLEAITGLDRSRIQRELERLAAARILRTRHDRAGQRYELQHDAFIPVLHEWRSGIVDRERHLTWVKRLLATSAAVVVASALLVAFNYFSQRQRTQMALKEQEQRQEMAAKEQEQREEQNRFESERRLMEVKLDAADRERIQAETAKQQEERLRHESEALSKRLESWQNGGILDDLRTMSEAELQSLAPGRFEVVTYYVLWQKSGEERFAQLQKLLSDDGELLPKTYGVPPLASGAEASSARSPIQVAYGRARTLDQAGFDAMWLEMRNYVAANNLIPIPSQARLVPMSTLAPDAIQVRGDEKTVAVAGVPTGDWYMVQAKPADLSPGPARDFIERFDDQWVRFSPRPGIDYRLVPAWSRPVWKLAGQRPISIGGIAAYVAILELLKQPDPLISQAAVDALLDHAAKTYPDTVAEARVAYGPELRKQLLERLQRDPTAFTRLPYILDQLVDAKPHNDSTADGGSRPSAPSLTLPVMQQLTLPRQNPTRLGGPWPPVSVSPSARANGAADTSGSAESNVLEADLSAGLGNFRPVLVYLADDLVPTWAPSGQLSKTVNDGIERVRGEVYRLHGVIAPGIRFTTSPNAPLASGTVRINIHGSIPQGRLDRTWRLGGTNQVDDFLRLLEGALIETRDVWVTAETSKSLLSMMPPNTRQWVETHYSLTDIKRLLRLTALDKNGSVRYGTWLLRALPFLAVTDDPLDGKELSSHLQAAVRARSASDKTDSPVDELVRRGTEALIADDVEAASAASSEAIRRDSQGAVNAFDRAWGDQVARVWTTDLARKYPRVDGSRPDAWNSFDLDDLLGRAEQSGDRRTAWQLAVYRLAWERNQTPDALSALVREGPSVTPLPEQARWVSLRFLEHYNPLDRRTGDPELMADAEALFRTAVLQLDLDRAMSSFREFADAAGAMPVANWATEMLGRVVAAAQQESPSERSSELLFEWAWRLCHIDRMEPLHQGLALLAEYERQPIQRHLSDDVLARRVEFAKLMRAEALTGLRTVGDDRSASAEPALRELLKSADDGIQREAYATLARELVNDERYDAAKALAREALGKWPDNSFFPWMTLIANLRVGDVDGVTTVGREAHTIAGRPSAKENRPALLFVASLAAIVTKQPEWRDTVAEYLKTDDVNRDYVRLLAGGVLGDAAGPAIAERWTSIDPSSWPDRFRQGDLAAWREMLIGWWMGAPPAQGISSVLEQRVQFERSVFSPLPMMKTGWECEASFYEAMRARADGRSEQAAAYLRRVVATRMKDYAEYDLARFLLATGG
jgi:hypothetical protein